MHTVYKEVQVFLVHGDVHILYGYLLTSHENMVYGIPRGPFTSVPCASGIGRVHKAGRQARFDPKDRRPSMTEFSNVKRSGVKTVKA